MVRLKQAMKNCCQMVAPKGIFLMVDHFHRWPFLARACFGSRDVIRFMKVQGFRLIHKSGVLFWPYREWLSNSECRGELLRRRFDRGEMLLSVLGRHLWADYKILGFQKGAQ